MILHLVHDDKVVPRMISQFEEVNSGNNIYICVSNLKNREDLRFLGNSPNIIMSQNKAISKIPWERVDKVCFHYLSFKKIRYYWELCSKYNISHAKNIWFMWGGDIYDILERKGLKLYHESNTFNQIRKDYNKGIFVSSRQKVRYFFSDYFRCLFFENKFDYVICNSKEEFELFCKYVRFSKCKELLHYHYYPIEDTLGCLIDQKVHGNSVIIGNSASPTNNHEYVVSLLKKTQLSNMSLYLLSLNNIINHFNEIKNKINDLKINVKECKDLISQISQIIDNLKIYNVILIPFIGPKNVGKTTIINSIIGKDILSTGPNE